MARSDAVLRRLLGLHPKVIDLSLDRIRRLLAALGHPERRLPPVTHVAGTNGKGSVVAYLRAMLEAAGRTAHVYTSPHLVRFHERIRIGMPGGGRLIPEAELAALLEECEAANSGLPITFFEITTAAAFLAFTRHPAGHLLLEVGLGGRLDATNVIDHPVATVLTAIDLDHQQFLGDSLEQIAFEKAGILKPHVPCVVAPQPDAARATIEAQAARVGAPLLVAGQDWQAFEQHGRLVYQDASCLLDLPLPRLPGRFQIDNAGAAVAAARLLDVHALGEPQIAAGLVQADWPARLERLGAGGISSRLPEGAELWLDGGHNPSAGRVVAQSLADLEERSPRPLVLVWGMLNSKDARGYIRPFRGLARKVITLTIPEEENAMPAERLAEAARSEGIDSEPAASLDAALAAAAATAADPRILICGSLYLAGHVLAEHRGEAMSAVSGAARR